MVAVLLVACEADDESPDPPPASEDEPDTTAPPQSAGAWAAFPDAPQALTEVAAAGFGGQVWVAGGFTADGNATDAVQVFDPAFAAWDAGPALPEAVHHATLVSTGDALYLVGGYTGSGFETPTDAVRRLDATSGLWEPDAPLPEPRAAGAAAWDGQRIVYGGGVGPQGVSDEVFTFDGETWTSLGELSEPREHLAAAGDGQGRVWFLAGRTGGLDSNLATVDLVEGSEITAIGEVPTPRGGVAGFWSAATGPCVVGGEEPSGTFDEVECIDAAGQAHILPALGEPRHGLGAAVVEGMAYVLLGGPEPGLTVSATIEGLPVDAGAE